jgi:Glycosyltransferase family 87
MKARLIIGRLIRFLLIVFALTGAHHFLRTGFGRPSLTDLYPAWVGSHELLIHHRNPYSPGVTREIQTALYGAPLGPGDHPDHECCFAYPVYVSFLLAPSMSSELPKPPLAALLFLTAATAIGVTCWHAVAGRGASYFWWMIPVVFLSPPVMQGLELRQLGLLIFSLLSIAAILAHHRHFTLSGIILALATIKPQMTVLPIAWMLLWAAYGWAERKGLIIGLASTMALLVGAGELLLPGWTSDFIAQIPVYRHYAGASMLELLYGREIGLGLAALFVLGLLVIMWRRRAESDFVATLAFVLAAEVFIMPGLKSLFNLVLLIPGLFILLAKYPAADRTSSLRARAQVA